MSTNHPIGQEDVGEIGLDLRELHAANKARQTEWCIGGDPEPDLAFRGNELAGETGEACNVIKKLERERRGWRGSRATVEQLAEELADVVICADLCAVTAGIDLSQAVRDKFNATSDKQGLSTRLPAALRSPSREGEELRRTHTTLVEATQRWKKAPVGSSECGSAYIDMCSAEKWFARAAEPLVRGLLAASPVPDTPPADAGLVEALEEIDGSFEAAFAEGLSDRLAETDATPGSLADLLVRRLLPARDAAIAALSRATGGQHV